MKENLKAPMLNVKKKLLNQLAKREKKKLGNWKNSNEIFYKK